MTDVKLIHTALFITFYTALTACSESESQFSNDTIAFDTCEGMPQLECGAFEVPLIHDSTDSRTISIDIARLPGTGDGPHEQLLVNHGGPGSGIEVLQEIAMYDVFPASIRERYDIIGFDQRGVSNPLRIDCDDLGNESSIPYPRNQSDLQIVLSDAIQLANACSANYADSLQYVGTKAAAKDMEVMRNLLGAQTLNMIGISFGSRITTLYQQQFPDTSGLVVLDAPLKPTGNLDSLLVETVIAEQRGFETFLDGCGTIVVDCNRSAVEAAFVTRIDSLLDDDDAHTSFVFFELLAIAVADQEFLDVLTPVLIDFALNGNPEEMLSLITSPGSSDNPEDDDASEEVNVSNSSITLERAVLCADDSTRPDIESLVATLGTLNEYSDLYAESLMPLAATCIGWPEALDPIAEFRTTDVPPSLVIGGQNDVNTPIVWAIETAEAIGGVFVSSAHPGHTTVFINQNDCVDSLVIDFLLEGTLPPEGTMCNQ